VPTLGVPERVAPLDGRLAREADGRRRALDESRALGAWWQQAQTDLVARYKCIRVWSGKLARKFEAERLDRLILLRTDAWHEDERQTSEDRRLISCETLTPSMLFRVINVRHYHPCEPIGRPSPLR
jgi:hypothetical protein